jgi:hypothetical protein
MKTSLIRSGWRPYCLANLFLLLFEPFLAHQSGFLTLTFAPMTSYFS